ncbi:Hypothetical predicted protein [Paramuricea clavata]|uniref:Mutator-like transposase domain-containing protein n=1 Tax=Paramuricea clavata TaxID=317549 RepID=A0A6S7HLL5_PARCT|nr:Hypothetical predicted protein [Paramuricea clavata]
MLGDGDSATYGSIVDSKPYGDECVPKKLECIGHVQKRVGSRLRKLKSTYKGGKGRLTDGCIVKLIEPIFADLSKPDLLRKCTHGLTQNVNECLNGMIWDRCPKTTYVEQETVALATYLAVLKFNDGDISFLKIFEALDITPGVFTCKGAQDCDTT